jgi:MFS family permease
VLLFSTFLAAIVYLSQSFVTAAWQLLILNFCLGLVNGGMGPALQAMVAKITPQELSGRAFGYMQAARNFGCAGGSYIGGQVGATLGLHSVFYVTTSLLAADVVLVYLAIYRPAHKKQRTSGD